MRDEGLLQRMQRAALRQALDGRDMRAVLHDSQRQARIDPPAIDQNRARAALAVVAAFLGSGQIEIESQGVKQRGPRRQSQFSLDAVDVKRDRDLGGCRKPLLLLTERRG